LDRISTAVSLTSTSNSAMKAGCLSNPMQFGKNGDQIGSSIVATYSTKAPPPSYNPCPPRKAPSPVVWGGGGGVNISPSLVPLAASVANQGFWRAWLRGLPVLRSSLAGAHGGIPPCCLHLGMQLDLPVRLAVATSRVFVVSLKTKFHTVGYIAAYVGKA
jgi:hypothetical protein